MVVLEEAANVAPQKDDEGLEVVQEPVVQDTAPS